ncbi:MAG: asparagine synthase (glutamine-hydrolyzing) [Bacteroidetes bacterium]|nr:asparagine synthase (glutamine-hydrolyzing) [Bacteroidota bacterium]
MCGIAGFIDFSNQSSLEILKECTNTLSHRGPDGCDFEFLQKETYQLGLGHRRLSIIDLSTHAGQPMWYNEFCIVFNGEIYNYQEIKEKLLLLGHVFKTHSDTEVILHAWAEWQQAMVHQFVGMFAFVIYDSGRDEIVCFRDRAGVKPFYYFYDEHVFLFASELKGIMQHPAFSKIINRDAAALFLQLGYVPAPYAIFEKTFKLKPGHCIRLQLREKKMTISQYWNVYDYYNRPPLNIGYEEAVRETEKILIKAFQYRMVSDVPVGVFLSGGYDSSCVTALLQKNNTEKIKTFTIGVAHTGLDEAPFAKEISNRLGTDHTEHYCTEKEALQIVPDLPFYYDEPFADSSAIPTTLVSKIAREKVTVALSADGGDEIFAGYNRYDYISKYGKKLNQIPAPIRKTLGAVMEQIPAAAVPYFNKKILFQSRYKKIKSLLKDPSEENIMMQLTRVMSEQEVAGLFLKPITNLATGLNSKELQEAHYSPLAYMMAIDYTTYLPDDILQKVDRATMSVSLEGREPFLDQHIIEWATGLPMDFKYHQGNKKRIIKDIVHKYLPKEMMDRPKSGFGIPIAAWLNNELKPFVEQYFDAAFIQAQGIFHYQEIEKIKSTFYSGRKENAEIIWYLLMFQMWYDKWMNKN